MPREGFALDLIRSGGLKGKSLVGARCAAPSLLPLGLARRVADRVEAAAATS